METLGKKTKVSLLIYLELLSAIVLYIVAVASIILLAVYEALAIFTDPVLLAIVLPFYLAVLGGGTWLIRRFVLYKKMPEEVIQTDGKKLYLHLDKEYEYDLESVESVFAIPESFLIHLFLGGYGTVEIKINKGKKHKIPFIEKANEVPNKFGKYIDVRPM